MAKRILIGLAPVAVVLAIALFVCWKQLLMLSIFVARVHFYGKVVDEQGRPVPGAETSYIVPTLNWKGSPTLVGPSSDAQGRFEITGWGPEIMVKAKHPKYYTVDEAMQKFSYTRPGISNGGPAPTVEAPAVFVLHKKEEAVVSNSSLLINKTIKTRLPLDGTPVYFNLMTGAVESSDVRVTDNSIILAMRSDGAKLPINEYRPFDWNLKIEVPGGGLQERTGKYQFVAPVDGYAEGVSFSKAGSLPRTEFRDSINKEFFVLLPSKLHARIRINTGAESGYCEMKSLLNPDSNSANLEFDPPSGPIHAN